MPGFGKRSERARVLRERAAEYQDELTVLNGSEDLFIQ
jgi:hypothetical protein